MSETTFPIQTSFNGGEFSRRVQRRVDQDVYQTGLEIMENWVPTVEGPAIKRPGFIHAAQAKTGATWLSEFRFNLTQSYVQEWSNLTLRFYTNDVRIESSPGTAYEIVTPYTAAQAPEVWRQQSFDRQYLAHPLHAPRRLTRTGALTFAIDLSPFENGPFTDLNPDDSITVTASATTGGGITLTATAAIFSAGRVGALFRLEAKDFSTIEAWQTGIDSIVANTTKRRNDGKVYLARSSGRTGTEAPRHESGTEWDGSAGTDINAKGPYGVQWEYLHDLFGIVRITAVAPDGLSATCDVIRRLPDSLTTVGSSFWAHAAFSTAEGWPSIVLVYQQRLVWFTGFHMVASVAGAFLNHQAFTSAGIPETDLAFRRRLAISDPVLWAVADRDGIFIGTATGEYLITLINPAEGVSGGNIKLVDQGNRGSNLCRPIKLGGEVIFVERGGRRVRSAEYAFERDRYPAADLTALSRHVIKSGGKQIFWQQSPESLLGVVRNDGQMALHPHEPEQQIRGWCRIVAAAGSTFISAISVPSPDGTRDDCWALIERNGARFVERQAPYWEEDEMQREDAVFVDSAYVYSGTPVMSVTAPHLANLPVRVLADGAVIPPLTAGPGGEIPLPLAASKVIAGKGYTARMISLRFEQRDRFGQTNQSRRKRIASFLLGLIDTGQILWRAGRVFEELNRRPGSAPMDEPIPLFNGDTDKLPAGGNWGRDGQFEIVSDDNLPAMVTVAMPQVEIGT
jgi:hypothetical protein